MNEDRCLFILMPSFGASIHIIQKFLFETSSTGKNNSVKKFQKPYFFTFLGSCGLFLVLILNLLFNSNSYKTKFKTRAFQIGFLVLGISVLFNLIAGTLSNISSLYLNYSVSLMLRSSTLLFGALISKFYLKRNLLKYQWYGILLTIISILLIGIAAIMGKSKTTHRNASNEIIAIFIILRIMSKSLQAISMIIEEKIMNYSGLAPIEICGLSGIWSLLFSLILLLCMEDNKDTLIMIKNNQTILILSILSIIIFGLWTILSLNITKKASAITRMIFDLLTIVIVWVIQISIHYIVIGTKYELKFGKAGEEWTKWSFLQLIGFVLMILGTCVYQNIIPLSFIKIKDDLIPLLAENE